MTQAVLRTALWEARHGLLEDLLLTQHPNRPWPDILITYSHGGGSPYQPEIAVLQHRLGLAPGREALRAWLGLQAKP